MSYYSMPKFALAIDWETSGYSTPHYAAKHQGISFGAIIYDVKTLDSVEELYVEIKFNPKYQWEMGAQKVHGLTREHLEANGVSQEDAAAALGNLVIKYNGMEELMVMGHRVHFDIAFTSQLMQSIGIDFNYHPTVIDSCSIATALMEMSKSEEIFQTLGMPPRKTHNALEDIRYTLASIRMMKEFFIMGVTSSL